MFARGAGMVVPNIHGVDVALEIEKSCVFPGCVQLGKFFKYFNTRWRN